MLKKYSDSVSRAPSAYAVMRGSEKYSGINGRVTFRRFGRGVLVTAEVRGLPYSDNPCGARVFGFHIHEGDSCTGSVSAPFSDAGAHYNPDGCAHPCHAGDLPPLFGNHGYAYMSVFTDRFSIREIIGRTVIIHDMPDDFTSQPSGNSGSRIACGKIASA